MNPASSGSSAAGGLPPIKFQEKTSGVTNKKINKGSSLLAAGKTRDSPLKVDIHTPALYPDNPVQRFEENLKESVGLLRNYQHVIERNKIVEDEVARGKQETISALVKQLVQRKQDHSVVCKCIAIINRIKDEFEDTKSRMMEDARRQVLQFKCEMVDKASQCEPDEDCPITECVCKSSAIVKPVNGTSPRASVAICGSCLSAYPTDQTTWSVQQDKESEPEIASGSSSKASDGSQTSVLSYYPVRKKSKARRKVHFDTENVPEVAFQKSSADRIQVKRVPLSTASINIYQNVIPESSLKYISGEPNKSDSGVSSATDGVILVPQNGFGCKVAFPVDVNMKSYLPHERSSPNGKPSNSLITPSISHSRLQNSEVIRGSLLNPIQTPQTEGMLSVKSMDDFANFAHTKHFPELNANNYDHLATTFYKKQSTRPSVNRIIKKSHTMKKLFEEKPRRILKKGTSIEKSKNGKPLVQTVLKYVKTNTTVSNPSDGTNSSDH